jgi:hypothetical protein
VIMIVMDMVNVIRFQVNAYVIMVTSLRIVRNIAALITAPIMEFVKILNVFVKRVGKDSIVA